jgi:hypothetical protein
MRKIVGLLTVTVAFAGENPLLGTWRLRSWVHEVMTTGELHNPMGEHPDGYLSYSPDGRMYAIITGDNRIRPHDLPPTDEERVKLHRTMVSYAGTYTVDAEKVVHHVDISWNEAFTGTDQIRFYKLDGNTLTITTAPIKRPVDSREKREILVWSKGKAPTQ